MKQIVALFAIVALASCGNGTSTEVKSTDSTAVYTDSTAAEYLGVSTEVKSTDSTAVYTDSTAAEYLGVVDTTSVDTTKVETK